VIQEPAGLKDGTMPDAVGRSRDLAVDPTDSLLDSFLPSSATLRMRARPLQSAASDARVPQLTTDLRGAKQGAQRGGALRVFLDDLRVELERLLPLSLLLQKTALR